MKDEATKIFENSMINKMASIFEQAVVSKMDLMFFIEQFCNSNLCNQFYEDLTVFSQGHKYILNLFLEEMRLKNVKIKYLPEINTQDKEPAFWIGYLLAYWFYLDETTNKTIYNQYDMNKIYDSFDMLHTQATTYAINWIQNEFKRDE